VPGAESVENINKTEENTSFSNPEQSDVAAGNNSSIDNLLKTFGGRIVK
jgi:hypothetical protein